MNIFYFFGYFKSGKVYPLLICYSSSFLSIKIILPSSSLIKAGTFISFVVNWQVFVINIVYYLLKKSAYEDAVCAIAYKTKPIKWRIWLNKNCFSVWGVGVELLA